MIQREHLHHLVDDLPEEEFVHAARFLESLRDHRDPLQIALDRAPPDDEPLTPADRIALDEAAGDVAAGRVVSHEEALRRLLGDA